VSVSGYDWDVSKRGKGRIQTQIIRIIGAVDRASGGALTIFAAAARSFWRGRATEAAASMAYYAVFSMFPMLLVIIALGSIAFESGQARQDIFNALNRIVPVSLEFVERNIDQVLEQRGTVGIVGLAGLIWSASGVFSALANHINRAWPQADQRNFLWRRLLGVGIIAILLGVLFLLWLVSNTVLNVLPALPVSGIDSQTFQSVTWRLSSDLIPFAFTFLMFFALYRWVPLDEVAWRDALWSGLVAAAAWTGTTKVFGWYLQSGLANYNLVYGSLGAVVALMFWIYISSLIALFGAHLSSAINLQKRPQN
jgi:membrane protein